MTTPLLDRVRPTSAPPRATPSVTTGAGRALQVTWVAWFAYVFWISATMPNHPLPPAWAAIPLGIVDIATWFAAGGVLARRRWGLVLSAALCLPLFGLAAMCIAANAGWHWIAEVGVALGVTAFSLHPDSWRMHSR